MNELCELGELCEFINVPSYGSLYYFHIYLWYDNPEVFSCISDCSRYYFVVSEPSPDNKTARWIIVPLSKQRLERAENNGITMRELITEPEALVYLVEQTPRGIISGKEVLPKELTEEMLPQKDVYMDYFPE